MFDNQPNMSESTIDTSSTAALPGKIVIIYSLGQAGWSLASYNVGTLLTYFYAPPELGKATFPNFLPSFIFFGLTILGVLASVGRLYDAFIDAFIANVSDKTVSRFGKRRIFMGISALPLAALSFLIFYPPVSATSDTNVWWLGGCLFFYYIFYSMYIIPYTALISELGKDEKERLRISTGVALAWGFGFLLGNLTPALQSLLEKTGIIPLAAFQTVVFSLAIVALALMIIPVLFLDENKYSSGVTSSSESFVKSFRGVLNFAPFRIFALSYLIYWLALTIIQAGMIYYVTLIFGMDKSVATLFGGISFLGSFAFYPFINKLAQRYSKKRLLLVGYIVFCCVFALMLAPIPSVIRFCLVAALASYPLAVFGILPNAVVGDIVQNRLQKTGINQSGMFFAVASFVVKIGSSISNLIFPSLLKLGKSIENYNGVTYSILLAIFFLASGYFVFRQYNEEEILNS